MNEEAWRQLHWGDEDAEYEDVWRRFSSEFQFRPSTDPGSWPSIEEPAPSITYDLSTGLWDWPVPALPNGDYYIFVARDLSWGVF